MVLSLYITDGDGIISVLAELQGLSTLIGVCSRDRLSVMQAGLILLCLSEEEEEDMDTVFRRIVVNAVDWNGLIEPCFTKCTAPWDNVVVLKLQMPTSSSVLLSLNTEDEDDVSEDKEDKDSISTSRCAAVRLETLPQTTTPLFSFPLFPYGE